MDEINWEFWILLLAVVLGAIIVVYGFFDGWFDDVLTGTTTEEAVVDELSAATPALIGGGAFAVIFLIVLGSIVGHRSFLVARIVSARARLSLVDRRIKRLKRREEMKIPSVKELKRTIRLERDLRKIATDTEYTLQKNYQAARVRMAAKEKNMAAQKELADTEIAIINKPVIGD